MIRTKIKFVLFFLLISFLIPQSSCLGQGALAIEISPLTSFFSLEPEQKQTGQFLVRNLSSQTLRIIPRVVSFETIDDQGTLQIQEGDFRNFVTLPVSVFELEPKEQRQIFFTANAPKNSKGGHYFAILFAAETKDKIADRPQLASEVGGLVFIEVLGSLRREIKIKDFEIKKLNWRNPHIKLTVENKGNTLAIPFGELKIFNWRND